MKVEQVKAFKSDDGCIWNTEGEAILQNLEDCITPLYEHNSEPSRFDILNYIKQNKVRFRYILANVDKVEF